MEISGTWKLKKKRERERVKNNIQNLTVINRIYFA